MKTGDFDLGQKVKILNFVMRYGWFSVEICKYKPGYKSHNLL